MEAAVAAEVEALSEEAEAAQSVPAGQVYQQVVPVVRAYPWGAVQEYLSPQAVPVCQSVLPLDWQPPLP